MQWLLIAVLLLAGGMGSAAELNRKNLNWKFRVLNEKPMPGKLAPPNVSETIVELPDQVKYTCSVCQTVTTHNRSPKIYRYTSWPVSTLDYIRKQVKGINERYKLNIQVDESQLCQKCSKNRVTEKIFWMIPVDGEVVRTEFAYNDMALLMAFLGDKNEVEIRTGSNVRSFPLKRFVPRLRLLLGMDRSAVKEEE